MTKEQVTHVARLYPYLPGSLSHPPTGRRWMLGHDDDGKCRRIYEKVREVNFRLSTIGAASVAPTPPAPSALLPRPLRGRGQCVAIPNGKPCPSGASWDPFRVREFPVQWTVGVSPLGEAARREGELLPPPLSLPHRLSRSLPRKSYLILSRIPSCFQHEAASNTDDTWFCK